MLLQEDAVQTLVNLGLTVLQAKVYLALARSGISTARATAKAANVASQDVYRVLTELQEKGLVEKIIAKSIMYKAMPIKEGLSNLLQNKKKEYAEIEQKTNSLANNLYDNDLQKFQDEDSQFKVTSEWTLLKKTLEKRIQSAQTSIDIVVPRRFFEKMLYDHGSYIKEAKKKGVKTRAIIQKVGEKTFTYKATSILEDLFSEIKYTNDSALFGMHIFDNKEVSLNVSQKEGAASLWSNDHNVVKLAEAYFENMWNNAQIS